MNVVRNPNPRIRKVFDRAEYVQDEMYLVRGDNYLMEIFFSAEQRELAANVCDPNCGNTLYSENAEIESLEGALETLAGWVEKADAYHVPVAMPS